MSWDWPYMIAFVGALIPGIVGVLGWWNERRKGNLDLMTASNTSAVALLQVAQARLKEVEDDLAQADAQYDAERNRRRDCEDSLAEEKRSAKSYASKVKEMEIIIANLDEQVKQLKETMKGDTTK